MIFLIVCTVCVRFSGTDMVPGETDSGSGMESMLRMVSGEAGDGPGMDSTRHRPGGDRNH